MDTADGIGIGLFGLAVMIVLPVVLYPPVKAYMDRRDHQRRMSRAWREAQATGRPVSEIKEQRSRRRRDA